MNRVKQAPTPVRKDAVLALARVSFMKISKPCTSMTERLLTVGAVDVQQCVNDPGG